MLGPVLFLGYLLYINDLDDEVRMVNRSELGTSLFEIALERTFILGAMALLETKSEAQ